MLKDKKNMDTRSEALRQIIIFPPITVVRVKGFHDSLLKKITNIQELTNVRMVTPVTLVCSSF